MSRQRIAFTESQLVQLNNAYDNGLKTLKEKEAIDNLSEQMGISSMRIKVIQPLIALKTGPEDGMTSVRMSRKIIKKRHPSISEADIPLIIKKQMNRISDACDILNSIGMEVGGLAIGDSGQISVFGSAQGAKFFSTPEMREKFFNAMSGSETIENENREILRTKIRQMYRRLWEKVTGRRQMVPYKDIKEGKIKLDVSGLPSGIIFKDPSSYGQKNMMEILKCEDLVFKIRDQQETDDAQLQSQEVDPQSHERNEHETDTRVPLQEKIDSDERNEHETGTQAPFQDEIDSDERDEQQIYSVQPEQHENVDATSEKRNEHETDTRVPLQEKIDSDERNEQETGTTVPCTEAIDSDESPSVSKRKKTESADSALSNGKFRFTNLKRQRSRRGKKEILVEWTDGSCTWEPEKNIPALFQKQFFGN